MYAESFSCGIQRLGNEKSDLTRGLKRIDMKLQWPYISLKGHNATGGATIFFYEKDSMIGEPRIDTRGIVMKKSRQRR